MRAGLPADQQGTDGQADRAAVLEEVSALLRDFNQTIQEEAKDRKYRFVVKRLMKANQQQGEEIDEELDYYRDDDDVAVLFTMPDGSKAFVIGNIEEVIQ